MTCYWSFILFVAPMRAKGDEQLRQFAGCIYMSSFDVWVSLDGLLNRVYFAGIYSPEKQLCTMRP